MENETTKSCFLPYAASIVGTKHIERSAPSEDSYYTACGTVNDHQISCIAVCDGMSDRRAAHSREGAQLFARTAVQYFLPRFEEVWSSDEQDLTRFTIDYRQDAVHQLQIWKEELADGGEYPDVLHLNPETQEKSIIVSAGLIQYASTLQLLLVSDDGRMLFFAIGDGCCQLQLQSGEFLPLTKPANRNVRGTAHITFPNVGDVLLYARWQRMWLPPQVSALYLASDGGSFPGGIYNKSTMQAEDGLRAIAASLQGSAKPDGNSLLEKALIGLRENPNNNQRDDITLAALIQPQPSQEPLPIPLDEMLPHCQLYRRMSAAF